MSKKTVSIRLSDEEAKQLDHKVEHSGLSKSDYIRKSIFDTTPIHILDRKKEFYQGLCNINNAIQEVEQSRLGVDLSDIRKEVMEACRLLSS